MSKHRLKCMNSLCKFEGMMDATSDRPPVKNKILETNNDKKKKLGTAPESFQIRCPKCGARWRVRGERLH